MAEGEPKKDWYAIGWTRGVRDSLERIRQASDIQDAIERLEELVDPPQPLQWKGRRYYERKG